MTASAPWARQFFACQKLGVHRATPSAVAGLAVTDAGIEFRIQCPTLGSSEPSAFKAIGDPDLYIRGDQVRVQIAWSPAPGDKLFVQAAPDGRRCAVAAHVRARLPRGVVVGGTRTDAASAE